MLCQNEEIDGDAEAAAEEDTSADDDDVTQGSGGTVETATGDFVDTLRNY